MKCNLLLFCITLLMVMSSFAQEEAITASGKKIFVYSDGTWKSTDSIPLYNFHSPVINGLEIPAINNSDEIVKHTAYTLCYNEKHEQANWVAYVLTKDKTISRVTRTNNFIVDPLVKKGSATDKDYSKSGYDRGHLAPAGDMAWSSQAMEESFYYSNMSPQVPSFNRGIWKNLEALIRNWAYEYDSIYIVTGPVLCYGLPTIGTNGVSVPNLYYKVVLDYKYPDIKGIGFIMPNEKSELPLQSYALTIDSVESITGIDFFCQLPDNIEVYIESHMLLKQWTWQYSRTVDNEESKVLSESVQCSGVTQTGARCKNMTLNENGYCYLHQDQVGKTISTSNNTSTKTDVSNQRSTSVQCSATTQKGTRCKRMTTSPNGRCWQHGGN